MASIPSFLRPNSSSEVRLTIWSPHQLLQQVPTQHSHTQTNLGELSLIQKCGLSLLVNSPWSMSSSESSPWNATECFLWHYSALSRMFTASSKTAAMLEIGSLFTDVIIFPHRATSFNLLPGLHCGCHTSAPVESWTQPLKISVARFLRGRLSTDIGLHSSLWGTFHIFSSQRDEWVSRSYRPPTARYHTIQLSSTSAGLIKPGGENPLCRGPLLRPGPTPHTAYLLQNRENREGVERGRGSVGVKAQSPRPNSKGLSQGQGPKAKP